MNIILIKKKQVLMSKIKILQIKKNINYKNSIRIIAKF